MSLENTEYEYKPRLSVDITEEQLQQLQALIPHGFKKQIFQVIVQDLIVILQASPNREAILAAIINRMINVPEISLEATKK